MGGGMVFDIHSEDSTGPAWFVTVRADLVPAACWAAMGWVVLTVDGVRVVRDHELLGRWRGRLGAVFSEHPSSVAFVRSLIFKRASAHALASVESSLVVGG